MNYKEICNSYLAAMSEDLQSAGMPMHETADLIADIYKVIKKHLGDEECTK